MPFFSHARDTESGLNSILFLFYNISLKVWISSREEKIVSMYKITACVWLTLCHPLLCMQEGRAAVDAVNAIYIPF